MEDLKKQVIADLNKKKEKELKERKKLNSKLENIILYTTDIPVSNKLKSGLKEEGVKFKEKDLQKYPEVLATVQQWTNAPILFVNNTYLIMGRDFHNANQCIEKLHQVANPDYIIPSTDQYLIESIKNLSFNMQTAVRQLGRKIHELQPMVKLLNEITQEAKEEDNNAKKNK
jgi:glutaredoxin